MSCNQNTYNSKKTLQSLLMVMVLFAILFFSSSFSSISTGSVFAAKENSNDDGGGDTKPKTTTSKDGDDKAKSNDKDTKVNDKDNSNDDEKVDASKTTTETEKDSTDKKAIKTTTLARCPNGYHRSPSGDCEKDDKPKGLPRCPNGYHRSPSGKCEKVVPLPNPPAEGCVNHKDVTVKENNDCVTDCNKGYRRIDGKCVEVPNIKCDKGYVSRIDDKGKQYCKKLDNGNDNDCHPYDKDGRVIKDNDCDGYSGYCPNDDTSFCWKSQLYFAKALAKSEYSHCGKVVSPFKGYPEVEIAHKKYFQLFKHVADHCQQQQQQPSKITNNNEVNNKITNKYTTKTNIITSPTLNQQKFNGSYQGTINARFIEYTDMPATSTVIVPTATTKTRNVLEPNAIDVSGQLKNIGIKQAKFISMVATVYDKFNQTLGLENAIPQPNTLLPGQSAPFKFSIGVADGLQNRTQDVAFVKYHWTWFDENGKQY